MAFVELSKIQSSNFKIMIFTEGTIIKHSSIIKLFDFSSYIPIGNCVEIIKSWQQQGAEIVFCTSRKSKKQVNEIANLLKFYNFTGTKLFFKGNKEKYNDLVEFYIPDVLIEDDCKSIGGSWQRCITNVKPELKNQIKSIIVKEYKGIDHLTKSINDFL